ncbi:MAG: T9SS type A sorting domain-containing protein [Bacteroidetes bacterium]|nr:T9SS type A sorting domain-containing protein [Bacteroidota bacterium]MBP6314198.1 T9SS type A sorting domain-containing protein [Chitinophagaceae bacterium]
MKKSIIIIAVLLSCISTKIVAQENVVFFQVEKENYLQFENFVPNTLFECYSTVSGGKLMRNILINSAGEALHKFDFEHTPSFVLNRKSPVNTMGTNRVQQLDYKEFVAKNISMKVIGQQVQINWEAQVASGNIIEFQVVKEYKDGITKIAKTYGGHIGSDFSKYDFSEPHNQNVSYRLQIMKEGKKLRYSTSKLMPSLPPNNIKVYPTICSDKLFVDFEILNIACDYTLTDIMGKFVQKGQFFDKSNTLDIHNLASGNYIIIMGYGKERYSVKIAKK